VYDAPTVQPIGAGLAPTSMKYHAWTVEFLMLKDLEFRFNEITG